MALSKFPKPKRDQKGLEWFDWFETEDWRHKIIVELEKLIQDKSFDYHVYVAGVKGVSGKLRVIDVEYVKEFLKAVKG